METYDIGNHHLISEPKARLAGKIATGMPKGLNQTVFGVSGGEAIDLAIKLARGVTGRSGIISARGGYHGHTGFALAAGDTKFSAKFGPMPPDFQQVPFNDSTALATAISDQTAAVILETIPATLGIVVPEPGYLPKIEQICRQQGALLILDEVQSGLGRTGKMWGFENFNVKPDIVVLGKGLSGGIYPITATVFDEAYTGFFREDPFLHISTFGGSEIGCLAALETLTITENQEFLTHVCELGRFFENRFRQLGKLYPSLGFKLRGLGLMLGLEFKDETTALFMIKLLFDSGVYVVYSGNDPRVVQFMPVLTISQTDAETIMSILSDCFCKLAG
jgi:acetylornithine/succinyldiaminopimelate/putrescine aminotransferase